ncbi:MAG: IclR family transcriptional regulator [Halorhabdus sp.]
MAPQNDRWQTVKATERAFAILETIKETDGCRLTDLADELGLAKSTVHRHLHTLQDLQWIVEEDDAYYVSLRFHEFGHYAWQRKKAYRLAREKVQELAEETDERVQFLVEEYGRAVYVHRALGRHAVETDPGIGSRIPLHSNSSGKVILAYLPEDRVAEIIEEHGLPAMTENTITDEAELYDAFERIRERGYAYNRSENTEGVNSVGVPVLDPDDRIIGSLSVSGPTHRLQGEWFEEQLPRLLLGTANELELNITHA